MSGRPPTVTASDTAEAVARAALTADERRAELIARREVVVAAAPDGDAC